MSKIVQIEGYRARSRAKRDALVEGHLSLAEGIARNLARTLPSLFDVEDLIGVANMALLRAATRYRPRAHGGTPFSAYARQRIRGACLDSVREVRHDGTGRHGLRPALVSINPPVATAGEPHKESHILDHVATVPVIAARIDRAREIKRLFEAATWLPDEQRRLLAAYYVPAEPTLAEVASELGITRSQAKELHKRALAALRTRLKRAA